MKKCACAIFYAFSKSEVQTKEEEEGDFILFVDFFLEVWGIYLNEKQIVKVMAVMKGQLHFPLEQTYCETEKYKRNKQAK